MCTSTLPAGALLYLSHYLITTHQVPDMMRLLLTPLPFPMRAASCTCRRGGGYYGGGRGFVFIDPTDIFLIWDPRYGRHQRERADSGQMTFVEAVFSFVFGDGNPNENFEVGMGGHFSL